MELNFGIECRGLKRQANATEASAQNSACSIPTLNLAIQFLCHTYLRLRAKEENRLTSWVDLINTYTSACKDSAMWMIDFLVSEDGPKHIRSFLLECPTRSVRHHFARMIENSITNYFHHAGQQGVMSALSIHASCVIDSRFVLFIFQEHPNMIRLVEYLLSMLDKDVPDNCKTCPQFFHLLSSYANMV